MQTTSLRLIQTPVLQAPARRPAPPAPTPAAQAARQRFAFLSQTWGSGDVSDDTRLAYAELGLSYAVGPTGQRTGKAVWMSLNTTRLQANMDVLLTPPRFPEAAPMLGTFTLTASVSGDVLTLTAVPGAAFSASRVLVTATGSLSGGTMRTRPGEYQFLEVADGLPGEGLSLASSWLRVYRRAPGAGTRVGVCVVPLTPLGFLGQPVVRSVVVGGLSPAG